MGSSRTPITPSVTRIITAAAIRRRFIARWLLLCMLVGPLRFPGAGQLRPNVARLRSPGGVFGAGYLDFGHVQPSMAIGADVLDFRAAELQRAAPGAGPDGHTQTAQ